MQAVETVILGGGLTGLSTALHLDGDWVLVEREERLGGLTRTQRVGDFLFDYTGHWMHLRWDHTRALVESLLADDLLHVERKSRIYSFGRFSEYPFQGNLYGLPDEVVRECLLGVIEAKLQEAREECGAGQLTPPRNFLEYVEQHFGHGIARHFMVPYNTKLWGVDPTEITADWCGRFVPRPNLEQVVDGALRPSADRMGYNASFVYPAKGGIETLVRRMEERLAGGEVLTGVQPKEIYWKEKRMVLTDGRELSYEHIVSSIPLPSLLQLLVDPPAEVGFWAPTLRCTSLRFVNLGLSTERPFDGTHWIYLPEKRFPFYRVGCASNAVATLAPPGGASCYVEISNAHRASDDEVMTALRGFLKEVGAISRDSQIEVADFGRIDYGYVIFDDNYAPARQNMLDFLSTCGVRSVGRYGNWVYSSMEDALNDGIEAARGIRGSRV